MKIDKIAFQNHKKKKKKSNDKLNLQENDFTSEN